MCSSCKRTKVLCFQPQTLGDPAVMKHTDIVVFRIATNCDSTLSNSQRTEFPFKSDRVAFNSARDVEESVLKPERGGETGRPTQMEESPHESHTKLPNFPKSNLFSAPQACTLSTHTLLKQEKLEHFTSEGNGPAHPY